MRTAGQVREERRSPTVSPKSDGSTGLLQAMFDVGYFPPNTPPE
jgi:hypothetical protein